MIRGQELVGPVAYIVSLKEGIPSFTNREIEGLRSRGFKIELYVTKKGSGLYAPNAELIGHLTLGRLVLGSLFFSLSRPGHYFSALREAYRSKSIKELIAGASFGRTLLKRRTRLIHSAFADRKLFIGYYASRLTGIPLTTMIHSHEIAFYMNSPIFIRALNACSTIFTVCEFNKEQLLARFPSLEQRLIVARLFVDSNRYAADERTKVLTVAKFHDYKGYDVLIKAAAILRNEGFVFWVVGDGPIDVKRMVEREGLGESVMILGPVNERILHILYQKCDLFCLPSKTAQSGQREGLPISLMEAMAFSKPVVSTRHAGIPELVPTILVEENNAEQLAAAIREYSAQPDRRRIDGERNRKIVVDDYSPSNLDAIESTFRRLSKR